MSSAGERPTLAWLVSAAGAILLGALWLRDWSEPYLVGTFAAITGALVAALLAALRGLRRPLVWAALGALAWFAVEGALAARTFSRLQRDAAGFEAERAARAEAALAATLRDDMATLRRAAERALELPNEPTARFAALEGVLPSPALGEVSALVFDGARATAWMGPVRVDADSLVASGGVVWTDFYAVAYAGVARGTRRAVVMRVLAALPPADRLASALAARLAEREGVRPFDLSPLPLPGFSPLAYDVVPGVWVRSVPLGAGPARLRVEERARLRGGLALAAAFLAVLAVAWRRPAPAWRRFALLGVGVGVIWLLPLSALSNRAAVFDPSFYYASLGGPLTASVGALAATGAVAVLALFALRRVRGGRAMQLAAPFVVLVVAFAGPFLLRDLARGITPPSRGVPTVLWVAWDVALFLVAAALLLTVARAGQLVRRRRRGLPPLLAPLLAVSAALLAPLVWAAPGQWPAWFPVPWIAAMLALALARRARGLVLRTALVAACGAATLVWGAVSRQRVLLAERDVLGLASADPETRRLLERFAAELQAAEPPRTRVDLLRLYVASDLAASGNPMELATWTRDALVPDAELVIADFERRPEGERSMVAEAAAAGRLVLREVSSTQGVQLVLAVPMDSTRLVTVVVSPRTRLIGDDPFASLLGLDVPSIVEPPYRLQVASLARDAAAAQVPAWERTGDELHGDWRIGGMRGFVRAHVEVDLRSLDALVQRGVLLVLLDLAVVSMLWTLAAVADGAFWRWGQLRLRRWRASYRARLTVALFVAFVIPAAAFAIWTYRRLQDEDRFSRELLVRETLRAVAATSDVGRLAEEGRRLDTPLFLYSGGALRRSSDELYDALVPLGRFLDPVAARSVAFGDEVAANRRLTVGGVPTLVGYRVLMDTRSERIILAAPARRSEQPLDRQRGDLAILLAFATAMGALAALWLSGVVARGLAAPIGELRSAALDLAGGAGTVPSLGARPPYEFRPVYSAFRQMASDLGASRQALLDAQRRTEAVLRNVASGVIACDPDGTVTLANARAERILGRPVTPGEPLASLGIPALTMQLADVSADDSRPGDEGLELSHRGRQLRARVTRLSRGAGGVVLTLDDVTDVARAQRVFAWGEMARQVAHEIKNPLTPIRLGVQHLRRARADRREDFDAILERNVGRILAEIDHLDEIARTFSKFGTAPGERAPVVPTDVAAVLRDVVALERLGDAGVRWTVEGEEQLLALSQGDELREVLLNLLENARHANASNVTARVGRDGERVVVEVHDDGDGIAADVLARVFEPHFSTRTSGSGLGLAISKRLVDSWGGTIQLTPASPRGTIARVTLVPAPSA